MESAQTHIDLCRLQVDAELCASALAWHQTGNLLAVSTVDAQRADLQISIIDPQDGQVKCSILFVTVLCCAQDCRSDAHMVQVRLAGAGGCQSFLAGLR